MADMYVTRPRRVMLKLDVHPSEIAHNITHGDVLEGFTVEEINRMIEIMKEQLLTRGVRDE